MVIEASLIAGYVIRWSISRAQRAGGRLDETVDAAIAAGLDRLHTWVVEKIGAPVLADLAREVTADGQASDLTRQRIELDLRAAERDEAFARTANSLAHEVRAAQVAAGVSLIGDGAIGIIGDGATVFTGDASATAGPGGIAIGQAGHVHTAASSPPDPPMPGR